MRVFLLASAIFVAGFGCSDDNGFKGLITLSEIVSDPVPVHLGDDTGTITFDFSEQPLNVDHGDDLRQVLYSGGISLAVTNEDTGVGYNLVSGSGVDGAPAAPGQYSVSASEDGRVVTVVFFNSAFDGKSIHSGAAYSAGVNVLENGHFTVESFTRGVSVTE